MKARINARLKKLQIATEHPLTYLHLIFIEANDFTGTKHHDP